MEIIELQSNGTNAKEVSVTEEKNNSDKQSDSVKKSGITTTTQASGLNLPINQIDEDHYVYRRGSTEVHVRTYDASSANHVIAENERDYMIANALTLSSMLCCMLLVIITLVIKLSSAISGRINKQVEDEYMLTLFATGSIWTTYYGFKGTIIKSNEVKFYQSNQSSNRWLKGVIVLFGFAIVLKDGLEFITYLMVDDLSVCTSNNILIAKTYFQAMFILSQVKYLFRFSKAYIQNCNAGSRTGLMMIIAINLSLWIASIVDETLHALEEGDYSSDNSQNETSTAYAATYVHNNISMAKSSDDHATDDAAEDVCTCNSQFCSAVHTAETFLFPFLIEFSLVASTLLYITWENIGKRLPPCERVIKPSYKFYKQYRGTGLGCTGLFVLIIFLILIGTGGSDLPENEKTYYTEFKQLILYESFLIGFETFMLTATFIGFYLFRRIYRPLEKAPMMDQILLIVCVVGPFVANMFSMVAVIVGPENKFGAWVLTLIRPLVEVIQCLFQLVFILYGLKREPVISASAKETAAQLKYGIHEHINQSTDDKDDRNEIAFDNKSYLRTHKDSITSVVSKLANAQPNFSPEIQAKHFQNLDKSRLLAASDTNSLQKASSEQKPVVITPPDIIVSQAEGDVTSSSSGSSKEETALEFDIPPSELALYEDFNRKEAIVKIVSETKVARPDRLRFWLRDVIMFLIITNAGLWVFLSLSGTAFSVYQFESIFYGVSAWTTITMICRPLNIFFRMHSAGCLFEMWSFA